MKSIVYYIRVENTSSKNTESNVKVNAKISEYILLCRLKKKIQVTAIIVQCVKRM